MRRVAILLALVGTVPLAACQLQGQIAARQCRAQFAVGSSGYSSCADRQYDAEIDAANRQLNETAREQFHAGF